MRQRSAIATSAIRRLLCAQTIYESVVAVIDKRILGRLVAEFRSPRPNLGGTSYEENRATKFGNRYQGLPRLHSREHLPRLTMHEAEELYVRLRTGKESDRKRELHLFRTNSIGAIRNAIHYLLYGDIDLYIRFSMVTEHRGDHKLRGVAEDFVSTLLHATNSRTHAVWNSGAESGLSLLGEDFLKSSKESKGQRYKRLNKTLKDLAQIYGFKDLSIADEFLYRLSEGDIGKSVIDVRPKEKPLRRVSNKTTKGKTAYRPKQYEMIREAAEKIGGRMTPTQIVDYISKRYPGASFGSIKDVIRAFTVNNPNRIKGYPENHKTTDDPKRRSDRYDILFRPDPNVPEVELYDPNKHGRWAICRTRKSKDNTLGLEVRRIDEAITHEVTPRAPSGEHAPEPGKPGRPKPPPPAGKQERREYDETGLTFPRNEDVVNWVKEKENSECQICGWSIAAPDGTKWIEVHHIWPLGEPHRGFEEKQDRTENAICLCPNHHREMHRGLFYIEPDTYRLVYHDPMNQFHKVKLKLNGEHKLDRKCLTYHRKTVYNRWIET